MSMLLNGEQLLRTTVFARQCWRRLCGVADHIHRIQGPERRETTCRGRSARTVDVKARSPLQTETATFPRRLSTRSRREPLWFQLPDANSLSSFIPDKSESGRPDSADRSEAREERARVTSGVYAGGTTGASFRDLSFPAPVALRSLLSHFALQNLPS